MTGAVEKLIGDYELERLMLFFERPHGGDRNDALHPELLKTVDVGAKVEFAGQDRVPAPMAREKCYFAPFKCAADIGVGRSAEWGSDANLLDFAEPGHGVQPASADNSDLRLWQSTSKNTFRLASQTRDYTGRNLGEALRRGSERVFPAGATISTMKLVAVACFCLSLCPAAWAREKSHPSADSAATTVPAAIDHNRVVIDIEILLTDGSTQNVHAWVDNGNPDLWMSKRVAEWMGVRVACDGQSCTGHSNPQPSAPQILIGGMKVSLPSSIPIKVPPDPRTGAGVIAPGMNVELNIP